ncbi:hypothetical protein DV515_00013887 [Chloebia gouldiae]|uniref:Secreted protein n=1 Tax=Chloebia gouldiae TaxID=44316 RepID=A0A3L8S0S5_CHLGU|nr:hypothetical protein DV515_00013887 [Chloebia gouldiae]
MVFAALVLAVALSPHSHVLLHFRVVEAAADEALGGIEGVVGVGDRLALGRHPHQALALSRERHHGRRGPGTLRVLQHLGTKARVTHTRSPRGHTGDTPRAKYQAKDLSKSTLSLQHSTSSSR